MNPPRTILIIDDTPQVCRALAKLLELEGYQVEFCLDGASGLLMAAELRPHLILLDVLMPGMDGLEVCRRLRQHTALSGIPIVLVTGLVDEDSRVAGLEAGADGFLSKPCSQPELRDVVRTILVEDR